MTYLGIERTPMWRIEGLIWPWNDESRSERNVQFVLADDFDAASGMAENALKHGWGSEEKVKDMRFEVRSITKTEYEEVMTSV